MLSLFPWICYAGNQLNAELVHLSDTELQQQREALCGDLVYSTGQRLLIVDMLGGLTCTVLPGRLVSCALDEQRHRLVSNSRSTGTGARIDLQPSLLDHTLKGNSNSYGPLFSLAQPWIAAGYGNLTVRKSMFGLVGYARTETSITSLPTTKCTATFRPNSWWLVLGTITDYHLLETQPQNPSRSFPRNEDMVKSSLAAFSTDGQLLALRATDPTLSLP